MFKRYADSAMIAEAREQSKGKVVWKEVLIFLAVFFVTTIVSSLILEIPMILELAKKLLTGYSISSALDFVNSQTFILLSLFVTVITTIGAIIYCTKIEKRRLSTMGFIRKNAVKEYLIGFVIGIGMLAASLLLCVITGTAKISFSGGSIGMILLFLFGYLLQGMSEEVLVRGYF
ncbi:MAG: hypothetical protein IKK29_01320, partial [Christensenellaceae bacterium]|nr:hypothetical protein [Christensenellaceae bacterium]